MAYTVSLCRLAAASSSISTATIDYMWLVGFTTLTITYQHPSGFHMMAVVHGFMVSASSVHPGTFMCEAD